MSRNLALGALLLVALGLAVLIAVRGSSLFTTEDRPTEDDPGAASDAHGRSDAKSETAKSATKPPTFHDWPAPAAVLVLTGEAHGYLEPCGCSEKQSGGVARRSDLLKQIRAKGWPVAGLDLGGTVRRTRKQAEFKFAAITSALRKLDYRGLGLGPEELKLGPAFLIAQHVPADDGSAGLAFLGANETFFDTPDLDGGPKKFVIADLGGVKVGAAMVLGDAQQRAVYPEGAAGDASFTPPADALKEVVSKLEAAGTRLNVLLSYCDLDESRALAKQFPQFRAVVSAGGPEDPAGEPEKIGDSWLVTVGHKGKYAGVLGIYPQDDKTPLRYELVDLSRERFKHDPAMDAVMAEYQQAIRDNISDVFADLTEVFPPREGTYVGAKKCGECHKQAFAKWTTTGHAAAYQTLAKGPHTYSLEEGRTWIDRTRDPDCIACHTTGWEPQEVLPYVSGFLPQEVAAEKNEPHRFDLLQGQQCENCHGPGSKHSETLERWLKDAKSVPQAELAAANRSVHLDLGAAKQNLCVRCHDYENSPKFNFDEYWKKVDHKGLRN
jgi:hypothetical protein